MVRPLSSDEVGILAALEEAGEESIVAVANANRTRDAQASGLVWLARGVATLLGARLVLMAQERNVASLLWIPLPNDKALRLCESLAGLIAWSSKDGRWVWQSPDPLPYILITETGLRESRRLLEERGWPSDPDEI